MKATLTFNLPADQEEYDRANAALDMAAFIWDWDQKMRAIYRGKVDEPTMEKLCEEWFEMKIDTDKIYS